MFCFVLLVDSIRAKGWQIKVFAYSFKCKFYNTDQIKNTMEHSWIQNLFISNLIQHCIRLSTVKAPVFGTFNSAISNFQTRFVRTVMKVLKYCWM